MKKLTILLRILWCGAGLHAQPPDTITANPKAVALRQVWAVYGQHSNGRVGSGIGGILDINGDAILMCTFCIKPLENNVK